MKKTLAMVLGLAVLASGAESTMTITERGDIGSRRKTQPLRNNKKRPLLPCMKHTGPIPKGCQLISGIIDYTHDGKNYSMECAIAYGSEKALRKKVILYTNQLMNFVLYHGKNVGIYDFKNVITIADVAEPENQTLTKNQ